jgi:hypothetical protein
MIQNIEIALDLPAVGQGWKEMSEDGVYGLLWKYIGLGDACEGTISFYFLRNIFTAESKHHMLFAISVL